MKAKFSFDIQPYIRKFQAKMGTFDPQRLQGYIYVILTLSTVSFFGVFAIGPTLNTVSNLNRQYEDNLIIYEALTKKLDNLRSLDAQFSTLQGTVPFIDAAIPKSAKIPYLTRQIENLVAKNDLTITRLNIGTVEIYPNTKNDPMYSYLFTVAVVGTRTGANSFIADIISFDRIVGIERITTGTNEEKQYSMTLTGRAFFSSK